jgi:hypothetical protein
MQVEAGEMEATAAGIWKGLGAQWCRQPEDSPEDAEPERYCNSCNIWRPERASHCTACSFCFEVRGLSMIQPVSACFCLLRVNFVVNLLLSPPCCRLFYYSYHFCYLTPYCNLIVNEFCEPLIMHSVNITAVQQHCLV